MQARQTIVGRDEPIVIVQHLPRGPGILSFRFVEEDRRDTGGEIDERDDDEEHSDGYLSLRCDNFLSCALQDRD